MRSIFIYFSTLATHLYYIQYDILYLSIFICIFKPRRIWKYHSTVTFGALI